MSLPPAWKATRVDGTPPGGSKAAYASNITYTAAGDLSSLPFANGITENHTWNSQFQNTGISAGNLLSLNYAYCNNGAAQCATGNTGSPWQQTIAVGGQTMAVQSYLHDSLNRISVAAEKAGGTPFTPTCPDSGSVWCRQFGYDNAGNRSIAARTPSGAYSWDAGTFNGNNRIADPNWSYDNNGNIIKAPVPQTIGYDAENRQVALCTQDPTGCPSQYASGRTVYVYDGLGNRVQRIDNTGTSMFVYDAFGNLAAEYGTTAAAPGTQYVTVDALGSTRLLMTGTQASERHDFQPYGDEITGDTGTWRAGVTGYPNSLVSSLYAAGTTRQRFTGQERDGESGLDYFHARYFSGVQGRFTSPDPGNAGANPADPQSWNAYAYVGNNPMMFTDPSGLFTSNGWMYGLREALDTFTKFFGGGGGGHTDLSAVANTPVVLTSTPTFSVTGWCYDCMPTSRISIPFASSWLRGVDSISWLWAPSRKPRYVKDDVPIYGPQGMGAQVLRAAGDRATHDLGCVGIGGLVTGGSIAASAEGIAKPFSAGGTSGTSIASKVLGGGNIGTQILTPVGTPGVNFAWRYSANLGRIAGRWLPYVGTTVGAAATYACLGSN